MTRKKWPRPARLFLVAVDCFVGFAFLFLTPTQEVEPLLSVFDLRAHGNWQVLVVPPECIQHRLVNVRFFEAIAVRHQNQHVAFGCLHGDQIFSHECTASRLWVRSRSALSIATANSLWLYLSSRRNTPMNSRRPSGRSASKRFRKMLKHAGRSQSASGRACSRLPPLRCSNGR